MLGGKKMFLRSEPTVDVAGKVLDEFGDVEGLKEVIDGILALEDSEVYERFHSFLDQ
ncbi:hypothetical protein [Methanobacterium aggregans]|uniref:hypothetical protein n=1 Tax=Methanobacterium aggregans TaxID=1615586 RepID=UPI001AE4B360|nr:hypothetical protein [Methanobacterium aggregans]MBP2045803.1 hypothetical protein [Methanobacterium aggregans]